jgi:hypothetical protein
MRFRLQSLLGDIRSLVKELENGLRKITIPENHAGFEVEVIIPAATEIRIINQLQVVPSGYIIRSQTSGNNVVSKGTSEWTTDFVYLLNNGASEVTVKVFFEV